MITQQSDQIPGQANSPIFSDRNIWYSLNQVCEYTSLSKATIRRLIDKGQLRCSSKTGKLLFKLEWVDKCLGGIA